MIRIVEFTPANRLGMIIPVVVDAGQCEIAKAVLLLPFMLMAECTDICDGCCYNINELREMLRIGWQACHDEYEGDVSDETVAEYNRTMTALGGALDDN